MVLRMADLRAATAIAAHVPICIGLVCGALNGMLVVGLGVHPFIITLGTMWILRGIAFVASGARAFCCQSADGGREGVAGLGRCALSGADARHAG